MGERITFGGWLKQRRTDLGMTQEELAERIGCSPIMLRKLEAGMRRPSVQIALLLGDFFSIPTDERTAFVTFARTGGATPGAPGTGTVESSPHAPWRTVWMLHTQMPIPLTILIGREREEVEVRDLLLQPILRLLTLTGPPGIGKTRLAVQVGSDFVEHFEDGVFFVDLAPTKDPRKVLAMIARTLCLKEAGDQPIEEVLRGYVRDKRLLLLLDNFEQVLDAGAQVAKLLEVSPWLKVLITSREALHVRGERSYPVPPLDLPNLQELPAWEELAHYPSVELFVGRAQAVAPHFILTEENAEDVAAVCVGLDGIPLAIELAAAGAGVLTPREMRNGLDSRLALALVGPRDLPGRQRTLEQAIGWSYDLLGAGEQVLFRRLAVFAGGFTAKVAGVTCQEEGEPAGSVAEKLQMLLDKSLVTKHLAAHDGTVSGGHRLAMLETIREFALKRLEESGELAAMRLRHAMYFLSLAEEAEPHLQPQMQGMNQDAWLVRLEFHHANLSAALENLLEHEEPELIMRLAGALGHFWFTRSYFGEGRGWLNAALARSYDPKMAGGADVSRIAPSVVAKVLNEAGTLATQQGDYGESGQLYGRTLALYRDLGDKLGTAKALNNLGNVAYLRTDYDAARRFYEESLSLARELGNTGGIARLLANLGNLAHERMEYDEANALNEESLQLRREVGDKWGIALVLNNLGTTAREQGDYTIARARHEESLAVWKELGYKWGIARATGQLGEVAYEEGHFSIALSLHGGALALFLDLKERRGIVESLESIAGDLGKLGQSRRASHLLGAAEALRKGIDAPLSSSELLHYEGYVATARAALDEMSFQAAWQEGQAMTMAEAVSYALQGLQA